MSLSTRTLPQLFNGVSRQPAILRSSDQTEEELNTWSYLSKGVGRRPPTENVALISPNTLDGAFIHEINRDTTERYIVIIHNGSLQVFDLEGVEQTVNAPGGLGYLSGTDFSAVTVADYTFIVNRDTLCGMKAAAADETPQPPYLRWMSFSPSGLGDDYDDQFFPGQSYQYPPNTSGSFAGELASMEDLPSGAADGTVYKIAGSSETLFTSYYVKKNGAVWDETVKPGLANSPDEATLPHALVREADGTFTFAPFSWSPRRVGDTDTNPPPTFIGRRIRDVFFYQNRLGMLVDENVIFSVAGDFGNYWRTTVLDAIASDVVDVAVSTAQVSLLLYAVLFNDGALLFADQTQFGLTNGEDGITPSSVAIRPVTKYEINQDVRPVTVGTEVYFASNVSGSSLIWEYTRLVDSDSISPSDVTAHVPGYLPSGLTQLIALKKGLLALTGGSKVYAYQTYWDADEKIQSAWREWEFDGSVVKGFQVDNRVYLVVRRTAGLFLECMDLEVTAKPVSQPHQVFLDRRVEVDGVYDAVLDETTFTFPFAPDQNSFRLIRGIGADAPHSLIDTALYVWDSPTAVKISGDESAATSGTCTAGQVYMTRIQFSQQFPLDFQGRPLSTGRLQLRTFTVNFTDTASFETVVAPYGREGEATVEAVVPSIRRTFTGNLLGNWGFQLNAANYVTGSYSFQVYGESKQATIAVQSQTHTGMTLTSAEWEGFYKKRSR